MIKKIFKHPLTWIVLIGFLIRIYGFLNFPVLHDEIGSILEGIKKTKISFTNFFFKASLENCLGITPLYIWVERFFVEIFGENNIGLRFFPLLSGIFTPILAYFVIKKYFPEKIALFGKMILLTTFGYGIASKQFLSGSQRGAFLIFNDIKIWPTETLLFVPFLIGLVATLKNSIQNLRQKSIEEFKMNSFLLICTLLPLVYIYSLGLISARFHFLYFVPFVIWD